MISIVYKFRSLRCLIFKKSFILSKGKSLFRGVFLVILSQLSAQTPDFFSVGMGAFSITKEKYRCFELDLEYKFKAIQFPPPFSFVELTPLFGAMATVQSSYYLYFGINFDLLIGKHIHLAPGFAGGYYSKGKGKNLGFPIEFRSGIELAWQFSDYRRLGVHFYHLSNASLAKHNPGEESLIIFYDIPLKKLFTFSN